MLAAACQLSGTQPPELAEPVPDAAAPDQLPPEPGTVAGAPSGGSPELAVANVSASESAGALRFTVRLSVAVAEPVTVSYATADDTATGGDDYQPAHGTLTFPAESTAAQHVDVPLSDAQGATLARAIATGTIVDDDQRTATVQPLELSSLAVAGSSMYPAFAAGTYHYARTCENSESLQVTARASRGGAAVTLLRANPEDNHTSTGSLDVSVSDGIATYVVHCLPAAFPDIRILHKTDAVSDGLLFVTPEYGLYYEHRHFVAIVDNNGAPTVDCRRP